MERYASPAPPAQVRAAYRLGVVRRDQTDLLGLTEGYVRNQIRASRWTVWGDHVVLTQNGPPDRRQRMWLAVMDAGFPAALASHTALELAGFRSWAKEADEIHLLIPRGSRTVRLPGLRVHESRRLDPERRVWIDDLPMSCVPQATIDAAAWQPFPRFACAMLAAVVQQRLASVSALQAELGRVGGVRHKAYLRLALTDIDEGAHASGELDLARLCRRFGLVRPIRQRRRCDATGQLRYLDAEWDLVDGSVGVLEIDGRHHLDVEHWEADMRRERAEVVRGRRVLRATNLELRLDAAALAADLIALGVPRIELSA
jgi:hypothetical protein